MLLAMARDVRVILHQARRPPAQHAHAGAVPPEKQERIARETLDIYAPIANRLGLISLYYELEDLGLPLPAPDPLQRAREGAQARARQPARRGGQDPGRDPERRLKDFKVEAQVTGARSTSPSIYKKMQEKNISFSEVFDIYGFRIIVPGRGQLLPRAGRAAHVLQADPGQVQGLHRDPEGERLPVAAHHALRPVRHADRDPDPHADMHKVAEAGVASHWMYKSLEGDSKDVQLKTHQWLQSLLEIQSESGDALEFLEHIKVDLFPDEVYVFSPKGKIFALPKGATPIDFAYAVHTDVGNHCIAAKVDGSPVPLGTVLRNGNRVEIVTDPQARPNPVWLSYVATGKARSHIRHYLKTMQLQESAEVGELLLVQALRSLKANPDEIGDRALEPLLQGRQRQDARGSPGRHRPRQAPRGGGREEAARDRGAAG
jgi:GTP pyrophosphokinase